MTDAETPEVELPLDTPIETVANVGDALRRLCQGAGKEGCDLIVLEPERGLSWDGTVVTEIAYQFGFSAKLSASTVRGALNHVTTPDITTTDHNVVFREAGKRFQIARLVRDNMVLEYPKPPSTVSIRGEWLARMLPILPTRSGHLLHPGVHVCSEGFVGGDGAFLCWNESSVNLPMAIVPKPLIARLPLGDIGFQIDVERGCCWATEGDTVWTAPLVVGTFPDWKLAFFDTDRSVVLERAALVDALKAICSVEAFCHFILEQAKERFALLSVQGLEQRTKGNASSRAQALLQPAQVEGEDFILTLNARKLLSLLDRAQGTHLWLGCDQRQDRAWFKLVDTSPRNNIFVCGIAGYGATPEDVQ